jgi:uncharacterized membrane protein YfcA
VVVLLTLLAAAPPDRSWADWGYDVSKTVASAVVVAFMIAFVGKGVGWATVERISWRTLTYYSVMLVSGAVVAAALFISLSNVTALVITAGLGVLTLVRIYLDREKALEPPPLESPWDSWARRHDR